MIEFIELADRVFEVEITPDDPGICRRKFSVKLASGKELSNKEWIRIARQMKQDMERRGMVVHDINFGVRFEDIDE